MTWHRGGYLCELVVPCGYVPTVLKLSSATFSSNVYHCILLVSLYVIHVILFVRYVYYIELLKRFRV